MLSSFADICRYYEWHEQSRLLIPYGLHQLWQAELPILIHSGILCTSNNKPSHFPCDGCDEAKIVTYRGEEGFYHCMNCVDFRKLTQSEQTIYETDMAMLGRFIQHSLACQDKQRIVINDQLVWLGRINFDAGRFDIFLLRGVESNKNNSLLQECKPRLATESTAIFTLSDEIIDMPAKRMVQLPLAKVICEQDQRVTLGRETIEYLLQRAYVGARGSFKTINEQMAAKWLEGQIQKGLLPPKEKSLAIRKLGEEFELSPHAAERVWKQAAPENYQDPGRPRVQKVKTPEKTPN